MGGIKHSIGGTAGREIYFIDFFPGFYIAQATKHIFPTTLKQTQRFFTHGLVRSPGIGDLYRDVIGRHVYCTHVHVPLRCSPDTVWSLSTQDVKKHVTSQRDTTSALVTSLLQLTQATPLSCRPV